MTILRIGVVASRPSTSIHLLNLAHQNQLVERVIHRGQADLWKTSPRAFENLFCCQVDVVTSHHLGYDPSLRCQAPAQSSKAVEKRCRGHAPYIPGNSL